ncbi:MAG: hypothetical protein U9O94_02895 [Nanoarchaeota archaeon]|nr:hypothetical protein [Nanoarchaeota archaeon]
MGFSIVYLLNGLSTLAISIVCFYAFFLWSKKKTVCKLGKLIGISGIVYLIPAFLNLLWAFGVLIAKESDFILIEGCFNAAKTILLLVIAYSLIENRNLLYFLFLFLLSLVAIPYSINSFFLFISLISYLLIMIVSIELVLWSNYHLKKAGYFGVIYSALSILFLVFVFIGKAPSSMYWFIPNIAMLMVFSLFYLDVKNCGIIVKPRRLKAENLELLFIFVKFLVFVFSVSAFIFLSTVAVHELGHALAAQYYGCEMGKAVIYDVIDKPHTEIMCTGYYNDVIVTSAGILLTLLVGSAFFLTGGGFIKIISYLIFGYALLVSYGDLKDLGVSSNIVAAVMFLSFVVIAIGVTRLSIDYIKQQSKFYKHRKEVIETDPEKCFWLDEETPVKDLYELVLALHKMNNMAFKNYVDNKKNDFAKWIKNTLREDELSSQLLKAEDKKEAEAVILAKLLKDKGSDKNLLEFICKPLLKSKRG